MFTNSSLGYIKYKKKLKQTILFKITKGAVHKVRHALF